MEGSSAQAICSRRLRRGQIVRALAQLAHSRRRRRRERFGSAAAVRRPLQPIVSSLKRIECIHIHTFPEQSIPKPKVVPLAYIQPLMTCLHSLS